MPGNAGVSRSAFIVRVRDQFAAAYLENREGGGARARRAPLQPRRAPYGRNWRDFSEGLFGGGHVRPPWGQATEPGQSSNARRYDSVTVCGYSLLVAVGLLRATNLPVQR